MGTKTKRCYMCGETKPLEEFHRHSSRKDGLSAECKTCRVALDRAYLATPEGRFKRLVSDARIRAKKKGLEFNLTIDDLRDEETGEFPTHCPITGVELDFTTGNGRKMPCAPSLGRINNARGYVKNNVIVTCWRANVMQADDSLEDMMAWCKLVYTRNATYVGYVEDEEET